MEKTETQDVPPRSQTPIRLLALALFSQKYPAIGETHGLSVVVGAVVDAFSDRLEAMEVLDLVASANDDPLVIQAAVARVKPNVVAIAVPYGTYDSFRQLSPILAEVLDAGGLVIAGGPLPTYLGTRIHDELDERIAVVVGEGESSTLTLLQRWLDGSPLQGAVNTIIRAGGSTHVGPRRLTSPAEVPLPYRGHLSQIIASGAQIFTESSRACSWAACSFCLRGLTDIEGRASEFRRLPIERLLADLAALRRQGVRNITFADEDFLGGDLLAFEQFLASWESETRDRGVTFDVSATIHSIYNPRDPVSVGVTRQEVLERLRLLGLNKVFLGIESGSPSQLRRYHKGHSALDAFRSCRAIVRAGVRLEVGFIMFDPLVTLAEIVENVDYLLKTGVGRYASGPTSELRLQPESRYMKLLDRYEQRHGRRLQEDRIDPNTLSVSYTYADPDVEKLVAAVRSDNDAHHAFVYAIKGLTRFGDGVLQPGATRVLRRALSAYRREVLRSLAVAASTETSNYGPAAGLAARRLASAFIASTKGSPSLDRPIVARAAAASRELV
jgi:radical SAM superfamily enzyme YgiQ (UPF0313 family)